MELNRSLQKLFRSRTESVNRVKQKLFRSRTERVNRVKTKAVSFSESGEDKISRIILIISRNFRLCLLQIL